MAKGNLTRRRFLQGVGGIAVGLPLLDAFAATSNERSGAFPKRFLVFFTPNGTVQSARLASQVGSDFSFGPALAPLEGQKHRLVYVDGLTVQTGQLGPGDPHQQGMGTMLTGMPLQSGQFFEPFDDGPYVGWADGISLDQELALHLGGQTRLRSLEVGVQTMLKTVLDVWGVMSYAGPAQPIPPENDPARVFQRLFGDGFGSVEALEALYARRKSVLDTVLADFAALDGRLGAEDRAKLAAHQDAVRDMEQRLSLGSSPGPSCVMGSSPALGDATDPANFEAVGRAQMDLVVQAFSCDLTRVATLQWSAANGGPTFTQFGHHLDHHAITHEPWEAAGVTESLIEIEAWYAHEFAYLLDSLASVPEGAGTLLDNTLVLWTSELEEGYVHHFDNMPYILAGGAGGRLETARYLSYTGQSHSQLLLTLLHAMDVNADSFGHPDFCPGPLTGLI